MGRRKPRRRSSARLALVVLGAVALAAVGIFFGARAGRGPGEPPAAANSKLSPPGARASTRKSPGPAPPTERAAKPRFEGAAEATAPSPAGRVALVIDDLGRSLPDVERLLALRLPLTYAVLPWESRTAEVHERLRAAGVEILAHLPMEAAGGENPGRGAIVDELSPRRVAARTRAAIEALPGAVGVNNHMGSRITADRDAMAAILNVVVERQLFFLDSRTTAESVAFELARQRSIPSARRDVFLDGDRDPAAIAGQFARLLALAGERGAAIGIGHPHGATLELLERELPRAVAAGFEFVPVSYLLERSETLPQ